LSLSDPALTAVAVSMFSAPATLDCNPSYLLLLRRFLLLCFQPFSQLPLVTATSKSVRYVLQCLALDLQDLLGFLWLQPNVFLHSSAVLFFSPCLRLLLEVGSPCVSWSSTSSLGFCTSSCSRSDKRFLVIITLYFINHGINLL